MPKDRAPSYTPAPEPPTDPALRRRYDEVMAVLRAEQTVAGAARSLGLSRNHFQTLLHKALQAMIDAITPKPAGRPARPAREVTLETENARLAKENAALKERTAMVERLLDLVGNVASGREPLARRRKTKSSSGTDEDPEPAEAPMTVVLEMDAPAPLRAKAIGASVSTVRRRRRRQRQREVQRGGSRSSPPDATRADAVRALVRESHGLIGATGLAKSTGLSRRVAADLKQRELVAMEHERKAEAARVQITQPGVVRGFDAMHMSCTDGRRYWLVAADAAVPYRTSIASVTDYDEASVMAALRADFDAHGPPLVLRLDRASCQRTLAVLALLRDYSVLPLHGPPHHPQYYGQLERQNREHRAWLHYVGRVTSDELPAVANRMRTALNALWVRPTLRWWTAEQAWRARPPIAVDRHALRLEVEARAASLVTGERLEPTVAQRRATESALRNLGLLTINFGGQC